MTKWTRLLTLGFALLAVTWMAGPNLTAQEKKEPKKTTKAAAGTVEINEGKDGKYRFIIRDSEGKFLGMSGPTGFATKEDCEKGLEELKTALAGAKVVTGKKTEKSDK